MRSEIDRIATNSGINFSKIRWRHKIYLKDFAKVCGMNKNHFSRIVRFLLIKLAEVKRKK